MAIDRKVLESRRNQVVRVFPVPLPSGDTVDMRVPTGRDYREWKKLLRDESGEAIESRMSLSDELLVASILINGDGSPMYSTSEVLAGAMDDLLQPDIEAMKEMAMRLYGQRAGFRLPLIDEGMEKN